METPMWGSEYRTTMERDLILGSISAVGLVADEWRSVCSSASSYVVLPYLYERDEALFAASF